jgi:hypothetical protein
MGLIREAEASRSLRKNKEGFFSSLNHRFPPTESSFALRFVLVLARLGIGLRVWLGIGL